MATLNELPEEAEVDVSDDDFLLIWETGAGSNNSRKVTRARVLKDVIRDGGDASLNDVDVASLVVGGATIERVLRGNLSATPSTLSDATPEDETATLTGAQVGDVVLFSIANRPGGLLVDGWVSSENTITFRFTNVSGGSISGATYTIHTIAIGTA